MNEQLKNLVWELGRRIWASVTNGEATASWGRQESAKMIEEYASEQNAQLRKEWEAYHKKTLEEQWELAEETITKLRERIKFLEPLSEGNFEQANELNDQDQTIAQLRKEIEEYKVVVKNYDKVSGEKTETITRLTELLRRAKTRLKLIKKAPYAWHQVTDKLLTEIENAIGDENKR